MSVSSAARNLASGAPAVHGIDTITGTSIDASIQAAQTAARSANSGNEVLMVQTQSAMQQRGQAVTMATQMLKSINDSSAGAMKTRAALARARGQVAKANAYEKMASWV